MEGWRSSGEASFLSSITSLSIFSSFSFFYLFFQLFSLLSSLHLSFIPLFLFPHPLFYLFLLPDVPLPVTSVFSSRPLSVFLFSSFVSSGFITLPFSSLTSCPPSSYFYHFLPSFRTSPSLFLPFLPISLYLLHPPLPLYFLLLVFHLSLFPFFLLSFFLFSFIRLLLSFVVPPPLSSLPLPPSLPPSFLSLPLQGHLYYKG